MVEAENTWQNITSDKEWTHLNSILREKEIKGDRCVMLMM